VRGEVEATIEAVAQAIYSADNTWRSPWYRLGSIALTTWRSRAMAALATPVVSDAFRDAARVRSLATLFAADSDLKFSGADVAKLLRGDE